MMNDRDWNERDRNLRERIFGGPGIVGLEEIVRRTAENLETSNAQQRELTATVKMLAERVHGEDGMTVELATLRLDFERKHQENKERSERNFKIMMVVLPFLISGVIGVYGLVSRSFYVAAHGVTVAH